MTTRILASVVLFWLRAILGAEDGNSDPTLVTLDRHRIGLMEEEVKGPETVRGLIASLISGYLDLDSITFVWQIAQEWEGPASATNPPQSPANPRQI